MRAFFGRHAPEALYYDRLEDPNKWQRLGSFLAVQVPADYVCHANRSADVDVQSGSA